jgi:hypothetical protein
VVVTAVMVATAVMVVTVSMVGMLSMADIISTVVAPSHFTEARDITADTTAGVGVVT